MVEQPYYVYVAQPPRLYEYILVGLLVFAGAAATTGYHVYHGFVTEELARERAYWGIGMASVGVASGLYLFAYGWQRGNAGRAVIMTFSLTVGLVLNVLAGLVFTFLDLLLSRLTFGLVGTGDSPSRNWHSGSGLNGLPRSRSGSRAATYYHGEHPNSNRRGPKVGGTTRGRPYSRYVAGRHRLMTHCRNCGEIVVPQPPRALCPRCGQKVTGRLA